MSSYVRRTLTADGRSPRTGWQEAAAWRSAGWTAVVEPSTDPIKAEVRDWQKRVRAARR